ncbi:MAG TPA: nucleotidyltransferase domain-containing protein [Rectinemataceae bacterium]|nr:nucleotidyltransferase domain-containing protein [Rectinemataceae bacterium]
MRITKEERDIFVDSIATCDPNAKVWLFGSRVDDSKRGGDIDLAILSRTIGREELRKIRRDIMDRIGEQHLDIIASSDGRDAFFRLAVEGGVPLYANDRP